MICDEDMFTSEYVFAHVQYTCMWRNQKHTTNGALNIQIFGNICKRIKKSFALNETALIRINMITTTYFWTETEVGYYQLCAALFHIHLVSFEHIPSAEIKVQFQQRNSKNNTKKVYYRNQ